MIAVGGLDPSTASTGVAWPDGTFSTIVPPKLEKGSPPIERARRLDLIERGFVQEGRRHPWNTCLPTLWVVEAYSLGGARGYASAYVAEIGGVLRLRVLELGAEWILEVPPSRLKKYATGDGSKNTGKPEMIRAAVDDLGRRLELTATTPRNGDEADAYWLRRLGVDLVDDLDAELELEPALRKARSTIRAEYAGLARLLKSDQGGTP
jgi:hypothetical protein